MRTRKKHSDSFKCFQLGGISSASFGVCLANPKGYVSSVSIWTTCTERVETSLLLQEELLISVLAPVSFIFGLLVHFGVTSSCSGNDSKQLCLLSCLCAVSHDLEFYDGTPL